MGSAELTEPTKIEQRPIEHLSFDCSQDNYNEGESFQKCIAIALGISSCTAIDPVELIGSVSIEYAGVTLAKEQFKIGEPASMDFGIDGIGNGVLTTALINDDGKHSLDEHLIITGPFGIKVLDKTITIDFPF